jgi:hypothetical protein
VYGHVDGGVEADDPQPSANVTTSIDERIGSRR